VCGTENPLTVAGVSDPALTVCVFVLCDRGNTAAVDCGAGSEVSGPNDEPGCCDTGDAQMSFNCAGTPVESAMVYIGVSSDRPVECVEYTLDYDFDA
jgi:hypothetical protein